MFARQLQQQQNKSQDHHHSKMSKIHQTPTTTPNLPVVMVPKGANSADGGSSSNAATAEYFLSDSITFPQVSHKLENIADESVIEMAPNDESDHVLTWSD